MIFQENMFEKIILNPFSSRLPLKILLYAFSFYRTCKENPEEKIASLVADMSDEFCRLYTQSTEDYNGPSMDFAKMRLQMGQILYYTFLEHILLDEKRRGVDLMVSPVLHHSCKCSFPVSL